MEIKASILNQSYFRDMHILLPLYTGEQFRSFVLNHIPYHKKMKIFILQKYLNVLISEKWKLGTKKKTTELVARSQS